MKKILFQLILILSVTFSFAANVYYPDGIYVLGTNTVYPTAQTYYGTCDTVASTRNKVITLYPPYDSRFSLAPGTVLYVKFINAQTYNGAPNLVINGVSKAVYRTETKAALRYEWVAGELVCFIYDGTKWILLDAGLATTSYYGITKLYTGAASSSESYALTPASLYYFIGNSVFPYSVYNTNINYSVGDRVRRAYNTWECNTAIAANTEQWTEAHWTKLDPIQVQIDNLAADKNYLPALKFENTYVVSSNVNFSVSDRPTINNNPIAVTNDIKNGQLTVKTNGTSVGTFTANQSGNTEIDIAIPTNYIAVEDLQAAMETYESSEATNLFSTINRANKLHDAFESIINQERNTDSAIVIEKEQESNTNKQILDEAAIRSMIRPKIDKLSFEFDLEESEEQKINNAEKLEPRESIVIDGLTWGYTINDNTATITNVSPAEGNIEIPSEINGYNVLYIGSHAFRNCSGLMSVTIPDGVTSIGYMAFYNCSGLTSVTIPDSVTNIESTVFFGCSGLTSVTIPDSVTSIKDSVFSYCSGLTSITIPNSVTNIGDHVFHDCSGLTSVTIPDSVTSIGSSAFYGCSGLTSVTIPDSVTSIEGYAFYGCNNLQIICYIKNPEETQEEAVQRLKTLLANSGLNLDSIKFIDISLYPEKLGDMDPNNRIYTFEQVDELVAPLASTNDLDGYIAVADLQAALENHETDKAETVFGSIDRANETWDALNELVGNESGITRAIYSDGTIIETNIVGAILREHINQSDLVSLEIGTNVTAFGRNIVSGCNTLKKVIIPNSIKYITLQSFMNCSNLVSVTIPNSVTNIGGGSVFKNCTSLTSLVLPDSISDIAQETFENCSNLTYISVGNSAKTIGGSAFSDCNNLKSIVLPTTLTTLGRAIFSGCTNLHTIYYIRNQDQTQEQAIQYLKTIIQNSASELDLDSIEFIELTAEKFGDIDPNKTIYTSEQVDELIAPLASTTSVIALSNALDSVAFEGEKDEIALEALSTHTNYVNNSNPHQVTILQAEIAADNSEAINDTLGEVLRDRYGICSDGADEFNYLKGYGDVLSFEENSLTIDGDFYINAGTTVIINNNLSQGKNTKVIGTNSFASGTNVIAYGNASHAEGSGRLSLPAGYTSNNWYLTSSDYSENPCKYYSGNLLIPNMEGIKVNDILTLNGEYAKVVSVESYTNFTLDKSFGHLTSNKNVRQVYGIAYGDQSHAEGRDTIVVGYQSHAEGNGVKVAGNCSHGEGTSVQVTNDFSFVWNGVPWMTYKSHGNYSFSINPEQGIKGFYIGETNLYDHIVGLNHSVKYDKVKQHLSTDFLSEDDNIKQINLADGNIHWFRNDDNADKNAIIVIPPCDSDSLGSLSLYLEQKWYNHENTDEDIFSIATNNIAASSYPTDPEWMNTGRNSTWELEFKSPPGTTNWYLIKTTEYDYN